jgi:hypothetical protein
MRRASACLLLALLCFGFALPFLQAQPSAIPACCRRDGKHHCATSQRADGFRATTPACPYKNLGALTSQGTALKVSSSVLAISIQTQLRIPIAPPIIALRALDNTQKRGPPVA